MVFSPLRTNDASINACRPLPAVALIAIGLAMTSGCTSMKLPMLRPQPSSNTYVPVGTGVMLAEDLSPQIYQKIKQARNENSIVLEVVGDDEPIRVLPLPPGQQSVFVSSLLNQTGVMSKLGSVEATLFRASEGSVAGIPMEVRMNKDGDEVRPESDYALRPGDRLQVNEKQFGALSSLIETVGF